MTTKEQERKALAQIQKIVAGLGEDSYIATAFEGCFDDAVTNIENDWGCSNYARWLSAEAHYELEKEKVAELEAKIEKLNRRIERFLAEDDAKLKEINRLQGELDGLMKKHEEQVAELQDRIRGLEKEATEAYLSERKDVSIQTTDDYSPTAMPFARVQYFDNDGFRFINVVQKSGWTTSYKLDEIKSLVIE